ncbi:MAG: glycosyltransferase family 2 protein [Planctomycetota bacterium]
MTAFVEANRGVVVIGRNEGERLQRCLQSVNDRVKSAVYVDSGSIDDSVGLARSMGWDVVELSECAPFTAARARNAGLARLLESSPNLLFVQFLDGDCELVAGWLERAESELSAWPDVAIVVGIVRERSQDASVYNRLCDIEWRGPLGEIAYCGGIAFVRTQAVRQVGGFDATIIAAEDTELCTRLRLAGWRILRVGAAMALHDAGMMRLRQWWRRAVRTGHAFAHGAALHGRSPARLFVRERRAAWFWAVILPVVTFGLAGLTSGISLLLLLGYPVLGARVYVAGLGKGLQKRDAALYAVHCVAAKCPQMLGQLRFYLSRALGRPAAIIEHKGPAWRAYGHGRATRVTAPHSPEGVQR